jgi:hypothetical protein
VEKNHFAAVILMDGAITCCSVSRDKILRETLSFFRHSGDHALPIT